MTTTAPHRPQALLMPIHRVLRIGGLSALVALPVAALLGFLVAGAPGAWGALIGMGLAVAFFGVTVLVALFTSGMGPTRLGVWVMGSWLVKILILISVLGVLDEQDFYSRVVLFVSLLVGIVGCLVLEALLVTRTRVPYVEPLPR